MLDHQAAEVQLWTQWQTEVEMEIRTSWQYPANKNQQHVERYIQNLPNTAIQPSCGSTHTLTTSRNVTEPAKIRFRQMQILLISSAQNWNWNKN